MNQWYKVVIRGSGDTLHNAANEIINKFSSKHIAAGVPNDAEVWADTNVLDAHVLYFSPEASAVAKDLLKCFGGLACAAPSLVDLKKIPI